MRSLPGALLVALVARGVLAGAGGVAIYVQHRDEPIKHGKRKVSKAVLAERQESQAHTDVLSSSHSTHSSSHSSHAATHTSSHITIPSSHASSHSSHRISHSSHSISHSSHSSLHSSHRSSHSASHASEHSSSSSHVTSSTKLPSSSGKSEEASATATSERAAASSTITSAPSMSATTSLPVFGGASSEVMKDILDDDYDAFQDNQIWATVTDFPPSNAKTRTVAAPTLSGSSSGSMSGSASGSFGAFDGVLPTGMPVLAKRASAPKIPKPKRTSSSRKPTSTKAAPVVTTKYATSYLALGTGTCPTFVGHTKTASLSSTNSWPAPSRSSVSCRPAPTTFAGTDQGFKDLCNVRYCDPPAATKAVTSSLTGEVTRTEIESLLGQLQNVGAVRAVGISTNTFSTGWAGQGAYGSGLLFEVTGDIRALDNAVRIADNILAMRNSPKNGQVMWTGKRELIWLTKPAGSRGSAYAGSENMSIIGNMVNAAIYILRNPCLWNMRPQWTNAPTSFTKTSTYLDRAKAYVAAADQTMDSYFRPYWFNSAGLMIQPNSSLYSKAQDFPPGTPVPWNRRALMLHGLIRLATVHELAPLQDPVRVKRYDDLAAANVRDFVNNLLPTRSRGFQTYVWYYGRGATRGTLEMVRGVHGFYDIWGAWIAWQRGIAKDALTDTVMQNLANTMQHQIYSDDSDKLFAAYVNGYANICNADEQPVKYVWGAYAFYARFIPSWYTQVAAAGQAQLKLTWVTAPLFWAKAAAFRNSENFWRASNYT